jgi:uncharacterized protein (TIGR00255 family)
LIKSMTGYGAAEKDGFKVEVRSLNHKYLDVSVRMPSYLMEHEMNIRKVIRDSFDRGKVDVSISLADRRQKKVQVDADLAREMFSAFTDIKKELKLSGELDINFFAGCREVLLSEEPDANSDSIFSALKEAVSKVEEMRTAEGKALKQELTRRLDSIEQRRTDVDTASKNVVQAYKEKLTKRVSELITNGVPDETRLAQEIAFIAQKADISEEIVRLASHIRQFNTSLSSDAPVGRRLDFLCQEMNREANTIASKVDEIVITNLALDIKTELEKIREQVQNIQ